MHFEIDFILLYYFSAFKELRKRYNISWLEAIDQDIKCLFSFLVAVLLWIAFCPKSWCLLYKEGKTTTFTK